jgi:lipopolysaccharide/colanic/teichoic acid biosynthesis glycosyltransferase
LLQKTFVVGRRHPETTGLDVVGVCLSEMVSTLVSLRKTNVDRIMGAAVLALLAPVLGVLLIRLKSKGPALFKQVRIIDRGRLFRMFKFRSMVDDAKSMLPELAAQQDGNEVLFKMRGARE